MQKIFEIREPAKLRGSEAGHSGVLEDRGESRSTNSQRRLFDLVAAGLGGSHLHLEDIFSIRGPLDPEALGVALRLLAARHPVLRARFVDRDRHVIGAVDDLRVETLDVSTSSFDSTPDSAAQITAEAAVRIRAFVERPFNLTREPPWRAGLIRVDADLHWLVIVIHHIAHDRWSRDIIRREIGVFYDRVTSGASPLVGDLPIRLDDVADWQHRLLAGPTGERLVDWWSRELEGVPAAGGLRPFTGGVGSRERARIRRYLAPETTRELRALANRADVGLLVPLLAAYGLLLREQGSGDDFLICTPMAGREDGLVQGLVGYLANIVVVRIRFPTKDFTTQSLLGHFRGIVEGAYVHQDLPMQELACLAAPGLRPRSLFALQNTPGYPLRLAGCVVEPIELPGGRTDFESFLEVAPAGPRLALDLAHDASVIAEPDAAAALERYAELLAALVEDRVELRHAAPRQRVNAAVPAVNHAIDESTTGRDRAGRERWVAARLSALLGGVDLDASLQSLGVGSLALLQWLAAVERELGVALPLSTDLTTLPLLALAERTLDHIELDTMLRRPIELGELPGGRGFDTIEL
ncbi:condensation domain-containing protein [Nannocystaceae bacterium ST9]